MDMEQTLEPSENQLSKLLSMPIETPVAVLNLFEFNEVANYQSGDPEYATSAAEISGQDAFHLYGGVAGKTIEDLGGRVVMSAPVEQVLIGHEVANWHAAAIMYFPSRGAFLQMMSDANFQTASRQRRAALKNHCMIHLNGESFKS